MQMLEQKRRQIAVAQNGLTETMSGQRGTLAILAEDSPQPADRLTDDVFDYRAWDFVLSVKW